MAQRTFNDTTGRNDGTAARGPRCFAVVGPFQSGKTTFLEAVMARTQVLARQGRVADGSTAGDASPEARAHLMSVEPNIATVEFLDESFTFVDCPGSVEFLHDMRTIVPACDAAIVVCEADERKRPALALTLRELEEAGIPRFLFLNKIDTATTRVRETLAMLQTASRTPLLLRQIPIWKDGIAIGFIDLALERGFLYREYAPSEVLSVPDDERMREQEARFSMLESLADYDDALMEDLIGEIEPPRDRVFDDLGRELREGHVVPVLFGSAERGNGITRFLKALRHEAPGVSDTRDRLGVTNDGMPLAQVVKTIHTAHGGKLSVARVLRGPFKEGDAITTSRGGEGRLGGLLRIKGAATSKVAAAVAGDLVAFARIDAAATGDALSSGKTRPTAVMSVAPPEPVFSLALRARERKDEVRLGAALAKLVEEDPALGMEQQAELGELRLHGQGDMHLKVAIERLEGRYGVAVETCRPGIGYRETIRHAATARGRHKKQTGGHGQFGDVVIEVKPLQRGAGFTFEDKISGGVVPRQYIPSVEAGVRDYLKRGPLGFCVVDVQATLTDGSYHSVDSSDMAFQQAAKLAMAEAMAKAAPVLLEPILALEIMTPSEGLSRATALVSGRRGQILGYDARPGWEGWDVLRALVPEAEIGDLIVELRSATAGVAHFSAQLDHLAELTGRTAEHVVEARAAAH